MGRMLVNLSWVLYFGTLKFVYLNFISDSFAYLGYRNYEVSVFDEAMSWLIFILGLYLFGKLEIKDFYSFFVWMFFLIAFIPVTSVSGYAAKESVLMLQIFLLVVLILLVWVSRVRISLKEEFTKFNPSDSLLLILVIGAGMAMAVLAYFGPNFKISLSTIYSVREVYKTNMTFPIGYFTPWLMNVVGPICIAVGLNRTKWGWVIFGILIEIYIFSITGHKTALVFPFLFLVAYFFEPFKLLKLVPLVIVSIFGLLILMQIEEFRFLAAILRRSLITQGVVSSLWSDYVFNNGQFEYGYLINDAMRPAKVINQYYFGNTIGNSNVISFVDAYFNLGFIWGLSVAGLTAFILKYISDLLNGVQEKVLFIFTLIICFKLLNTGFQTVLLTHGLILMYLLIAKLKLFKYEN